MIKKWKVTIPRLTGDKTRTAYIYLPASYEKQKDRRYPVLYMFDGHNVFFDADATYGKSWGMQQYMQRSKKQLIIVAVECNHEGNKRLSEYSPVNFEFGQLGKIKGMGKFYMQWLVSTLKPYIDSHYRTLADREHTMIAGSSMGGLMSLYAVTAYNSVFGKAACLSPSLWVDFGKVMELVARSTVAPKTTIFMDYGELDLKGRMGMQEALVSMSHLLLSKHANLTLRILPGGGHNEASWEREIPFFMECLDIQ